MRRQFLDDIMVQLRPRMAGVKAEYEKVLRQRAALLKACGVWRRRGQQVDGSALDVWDMQLARLGAQITAARSHIVAGLRPHVDEYYRAVSGGAARRGWTTWTRRAGAFFICHLLSNFWIRRRRPANWSAITSWN